MTNNKIPTKLSKRDRRDMIQYINVQRASLGQPLFSDDSDGSPVNSGELKILAI